jgi:hypothetical protein
MAICGYCKNELELTRGICACAERAITALNNWFIQNEEELQIESFFKYRKDFEESLKLILGKEKWEKMRRLLKGLDLEEAYRILNDKKSGCGSNFLGENSSIRETFLKFRRLLSCYLPYADSNGEICLSVKPDTVPDLEARTAKSYRIVKALQFIIENSKSLRTDQIIELKEKFKKGKKRESIQENSGGLQARDIEREKLALEKELKEVKLREQQEIERAEQEKKRAELESKKNDVYKKISMLTLEEEEKLDRILDSAEVKKFLSNALSSRIIKQVSNCSMDRGGAIYVEEVNWIKEEEICGVYGVDLFLPADYQKIRAAFLDEIKSNPENWEVNWELFRGSYRITSVKERGKPRIHNCPGFKFTQQEVIDIITIFEQAEREWTGERQDPANAETGTAVLGIFVVLFWFFAVIAFFWWGIRRIIKVVNIFKKGTERNKTLEIFLGTDWNNRKLIVFDYQPTEEERKIFESRFLVDSNLLKLESNVLKTRYLLALVKYYESEGRIKKDSQINELLLVKLENFRLAESSTSESKAYLSVNVNGRVDKIIEELIHWKKVQMFEPIFW